MQYDPEKPDDEGEPAEAFIPLAAPVVLPRSERVVMLGEVPAAQVAVLVHAGDYASIGGMYPGTPTTRPRSEPRSRGPIMPG